MCTQKDEIENNLLFDVRENVNIIGLPFSGKI